MLQRAMHQGACRPPLLLLNPTCAYIKSICAAMFALVHESERANALHGFLRPHRKHLSVSDHERVGACNVKVALKELAEAAACSLRLVTAVHARNVVPLDVAQAVERNVACKGHRQIIAQAQRLAAWPNTRPRHDLSCCAGGTGLTPCRTPSCLAEGTCTVDVATVHDAPGCADPARPLESFMSHPDRPGRR